MPDKNIVIYLTIKENDNKEEIKKIVEEVLEEKARDTMRRGFELIPGMINN